MTHAQIVALMTACAECAASPSMEHLTLALLLCLKTFFYIMWLNTINRSKGKKLCDRQCDVVLNPKTFHTHSHLYEPTEVC